MNTTTIREAVVGYRQQEQAPPATRRPEDVAEFFRRVVEDEAREHFCALYLNQRNVPIAYQIVSVGTASASLVHPREVFQPAILAGAASLVLAHNHPSGDTSPSSEDVEVTRRIISAGRILGVGVVDHVVFAHAGGFASLREACAVHGLVFGGAA